MPRRCQGHIATGLQEFGVGWFSSSPAIFLLKENSGCSNLVVFCVCKAKVYICAVLDSAKAGIVWVALCFPPFIFTIAALKMRQIEQSRVLCMWAPQTFFGLLFVVTSKHCAEIYNVLPTVSLQVFSQVCVPPWDI